MASVSRYGEATEPESRWSRPITIGALISPEATISLKRSPAASRSPWPSQQIRAGSPWKATLSSARKGGRPLLRAVSRNRSVRRSLMPATSATAIAEQHVQPGDYDVAERLLRRLTPDEDGELPEYGLGVTNVVDRPTRTAAELTADELRAGAAALAELVARYRPGVLAVLGITAWRVAFDRPRAGLGVQPERVGGATTWVVPNPSGLNAHHQLPDLAASYHRLRPDPDRG
jgi:G:T/U-mismatch repair DNA glycosylase